MTGPNDLVPLPPIPERQRPDWPDAQADTGERAVAYATVRAIYQHFATGTPSRSGLIVVLRAFADLLEEEQR